MNSITSMCHITDNKENYYIDTNKNNTEKLEKNQYNKNDIIVKGNKEKKYKAIINQEAKIPQNYFTENYDIDTAKIWISKHEKEYQGCLYELLSKIKRISFDEFKNELKNSTKNIFEKLTNNVKEKNEIKNILEKTIVLVENKKSNQWVAELARKYLGFKPSSYYRLGDKDAGKFVQHINGLSEKTDKEELESFKGKIITLFDDGSYSGKQITDHVVSLLNLQEKLGFDKICVIVPYMTDYSKERLNKVATENVIISTSVKIKTVAESVSKNTAKKLTELWWKKEAKEEGPNSKGVIWFDHKIPNDQSFPGALEKGNVTNKEKICKTLFRFIPDIAVPYKN